MVYGGFKEQTAIALAKKFKYSLSGLTSSDPEYSKGIFKYDYSFLNTEELNKVLFLASYELDFMYQFTFKEKEPSKLFYTRCGSEKKSVCKDVLVSLFCAIVTTAIIFILAYPFVGMFLRRLNE
jgi:hypothetical protein